MKNEIILFENQEIKLEVNMKDETVWLSQKGIAKVFDVGVAAISKHLKNIFKEQELDEKVVVSKMENTTIHGAIEGKTQTSEIKMYNLDAIIAVGYRINSKRATEFRIWANKILKNYIIKGYAVNQKRLEYLEKTVKLIDIASRIDEYSDNNEAKEIINIIKQYSNALDLLDDYDHKRIIKPKGENTTKQVTYEECLEVINKLRFNNDSNLFALERDQGLKSIINNIYQSYDGKDLYSTTFEKAANFLYLVVKNHVFIDGNKRIAATLFIYFLNFNNILYKEKEKIIDNNALVAMTLLIAESSPNEKEILIDLVMNFLKGSEKYEY